jgi:hypothetical protein
VRLVEDFDQRAPLVDALDDVDTVHHRAGCTIPLGHDQNIAGAELVDGLLELRPVANVLGARLLAEDEVAAFSPEGADLPVEVLAGCGDPGVSDLA